MAMVSGQNFSWFSHTLYFSTRGFMGTVIIHLFIFCLLQLVKLSAYNLEFLTLLKNKNLKTQHIIQTYIMKGGVPDID
jgi:hypothetical protein